MGFVSLALTWAVVGWAFCIGAILGLETFVWAADLIYDIRQKKNRG